MDRTKTAVSGFIFVLGLILGLLGYAGHLYTTSTATVLMLAMWTAGGGIARFVMDDKRAPAIWPDGTWPVARP